MKIYFDRMKKDKKLIVIFSLFLLLIIIAIFSTKIAPNDPYEVDYENSLESSSYKYPMGTDQLGRCVMSRLLFAAKRSIYTVFLIVGLTSFVGTFIGILSGLTGGFIDNIIMRIVDMLLSFPGMIFIIAIVSFLGVGLLNIIIAMVFLGWMKYARLSRSLAINLKNSNYILEAKLGGAGFIKLMSTYIFPNVFPHIIVLMTQDLGQKLLTLSSLSLLGLGATPPTPEWGLMLSEGKPFMITAPWLLYYPGLIILIYVVVFNLLGDSLRDVLDPRFNVNKNDKKGWIYK